jgi:hypothetical protein
MAQAFRNRTAAFGWEFMIVWLVMLCAFTWIMLRDGPPQQPRLSVAALLLFWLVGVPAALHVFAIPIVHKRSRKREITGAKRGMSTRNASCPWIDGSDWKST